MSNKDQTYNAVSGMNKHTNNGFKLNVMTIIKEERMRDYIVVAKVAIMPEITSCQIWLAAIKMAEQAR